MQQLLLLQCCKTNKDFFILLFFSHLFYISPLTSKKGILFSHFRERSLMLQVFGNAIVHAHIIIYSQHKRKEFNFMRYHLIMKYVSMLCRRTNSNAGMHKKHGSVKWNALHIKYTMPPCIVKYWVYDNNNKVFCKDDTLL